MNEKLDLRLLVLSLFIVISLCTGFVLYRDVDRGGNATVTLFIDFGESGSLYSGNITVWENGKIVESTRTGNNTTLFEFRGIEGKNMSVFSVLMTGAEWGNFSVHYTEHLSPGGVFIDSICGVENGNKNWQYYINGVYGVRSCDSMPVKDGDNVSWVYR